MSAPPSEEFPRTAASMHRHQWVQDHIDIVNPPAYLNGTKQPDAFKWLLTQRIGTKDKIYGYLGPKFVELVWSCRMEERRTFGTFIRSIPRPREMETENG